MTQRERHLLALCYMEIESELQGIAEGRVVDGDPATTGGDLLDEPRRIAVLTNRLGRSPKTMRHGWGEPVDVVAAVGGLSFEGRSKEN